MKMGILPDTLKSGLTRAKLQSYGGQGGYGPKPRAFGS